MADPNMLAPPDPQGRLGAVSVKPEVKGLALQAMREGASAQEVLSQVFGEEIGDPGFANVVLAQRFGIEVPEPPTFTQQLMTDAPETLGGIAGGVAGLIAPIPVPPGVKETVGSAIGGGIGKGAQLVPRVLKGEMGVREAAGEVGKAATRQAGSALLARGAGKLLQFGFGRSRGLTKEGEQAMEWIEGNLPLGQAPFTKTPPFGLVSRALGKREMAVTPAQVTEHSGWDFWQNIAEKSFFGARRVRDVKLRGEALTRKAIEEFTDTLGERATAEELGLSIVQANRGLLKAQRLTESAAYNTLKEQALALGEGKTFTRTITSTIVDEFGKPITREVTEEVPGLFIPLKRTHKFTGERAELLEQLNNFGQQYGGDKLVATIRGLGDDTPFEAALELSSRLGKVAQEAAETGNRSAAFQLRKMTKALQRDIREGLREQAPELLPDYDAAKALTRSIYRNTDNDFIRSLVKQVMYGNEDPARATSTLFSNLTSSGARKLRKALPAKEFDDLAANYVASILRDAQAEKVGGLSGEALQNALAANSETLRVVFDHAPEKLRWLGAAANALGVVQAKQPTALGAWLIQGAQGSAAIRLGNIAVGQAFPNPVSEKIEGTLAGIPGATVVPATILIGPYVLARMVTNPTSARWLVRASQVKPGTEQAVKVTARLAQAVVRAKNELTPAEVAAEMQLRQLASPGLAPGEISLEAVATP